MKKMFYVALLVACTTVRTLAGDISNPSLTVPCGDISNPSCAVAGPANEAWFSVLGRLLALI